jgi:hypothetical protein
MSIQSDLERFLATYLSARQGPFGGAAEVMHVMHRLKMAFQESAIVAQRPALHVKASAGMGNWARVPWIAILNLRVSKSTQQGIYPVWLFREDMTGLYLTLNQGVTKAKRAMGGSEARVWLRMQADNLRKHCQNLPPAGFSLDPAIDLRTEHGLGADYENSTIAYKLYPSGGVPQDKVLLSDLNEVLESYDRCLGEADIQSEPLGTNAD